MPAPIVETVYLLCRKSCAWFQYICQVKNPDEKNTRYVNLLGNNINKPLVHWGGGEHLYIPIILNEKSSFVEGP